MSVVFLKSFLHLLCNFEIELSFSSFGSVDAVSVDPWSILTRVCSDFATFDQA